MLVSDSGRGIWDADDHQVCCFSHRYPCGTVGNVANLGVVKTAAPEVAPPPPAAAAAKRVARFPTAQDIRPGAGREEFRAEYGEPNLRASLYDRGSLLETFVYQNEARSATTWARLRNGSVIASATAGFQ